MRKPLVLVLTAAAVGGGLLAAPASATDATFTITGGALSIAQPASVTLTGGGSSLLGASVTGALGATTVTDERNGTVGWTSRVHGTDFSNGTTTIAIGNVKAYVPTLPAMTVTGVVTASQGVAVDALNGVTVAGAAPGNALVTATAVVGNNTVAFTPHISIPIPSNATAGTYSGTITQTVS